MSRKILERTIRSFVAAGSGIPSENVRQGRHTDNAPEGLYASVTMRSEVPVGYVSHQQRVEARESYTIDAQTLMTTFDVQFYREGAIDAANRFAMFARSETGCTWAATALTCGRIAGVNVYEGGENYNNGDSFYLPHDELDDAPNNTATGRIQTNGLSSASIAALLESGGNNYSEMPDVVINGIGTGATAAPRGYGFTIERIKVRNLTGIESGEFEERAQIDLDINHTRIYNDENSGRVEKIRGPYDINDAKSDSGDKLMYVYQTNLVPSSPATITMASGDNAAGILIPRVAEWTTNAAAVDSTTGFGEIRLLQTERIVPQHPSGQSNIIATSPFITNYEGHVVASFTGNSGTTLSFNTMYYMKTTHKITGRPTDIVSYRAIKAERVSIATGTTWSVEIPMVEFNSMVLLENEIPNGGTIGIYLDIGVATSSNLTELQNNQLLRELNTNSTTTLTPVTGINYQLTGFNTRVTFLQHELG